MAICLLVKPSVLLNTLNEIFNSKVLGFRVTFLYKTQIAMCLNYFFFFSNIKFSYFKVIHCND